ncbi:MAG: hypothetical protein J0M19_07045 [Sphingomonadales bacterium]|nr:hypothetical protein [Sphingomonadales bacterium]
MSRFAAFFFPLAVLAAPVVAQTPAPKTAPAPMPKVDRPSDMGCFMRMLDLRLMASKGAEDKARTEEQRTRSAALVVLANNSAAYYAGRLGPAFAKTNHFAAGDAEYKKMRANSSDVSAAEMAVCMRDSEVGQQAVLQSMAPPKPATK